MKERTVFWGMISLLLAFGLIFMGCPTDGGTEEGEMTKFEGSWQNQHPDAAHATYTFANDMVTYTRDDFEAQLGTFTYNDTSIEMSFANNIRVNFAYQLTKTTLYLNWLEGGDGQYYQGFHVKQ
jgi:hypothetical protein